MDQEFEKLALFSSNFQSPCNYSLVLEDLKEIEGKYRAKIQNLISNYSESIIASSHLMPIEELVLRLMCVEDCCLKDIADFISKQLVFKVKAIDATDMMSQDRLTAPLDQANHDTRDCLKNDNDRLELTDDKVNESKPHKTIKRQYISKKVRDVLELWIKLNRENPYPSKEEKIILCNSTGLSYQRLTNWFINRRIKLTKEKMALANRKFKDLE